MLRQAQQPSLRGCPARRGRHGGATPTEKIDQLRNYNEPNYFGKYQS